MSHHVGFKLGTKAVLLCHSIFSEIMFFFFFTWTFPPPDHALSDLRDLRAGFAKGRRVLHDLPCAGLLAPLEATGSTRFRAGAPLAPFTHLTVH